MSNADTARPVIVRHGHDGGDIPDYHEPVWLGESILRDAYGRPHRNAWRRFARVVCNNPGCPFEALVNAEAVTALIGGLEGGR